MKALCVPNTVFELYYLSAVGYLLKLAEPETELRLLTTQRVFQKLNPELAKLYASINVVRFPGLVRRPWFDVAQSRAFVKQLRELEPDCNIVLVGSFREYYANIICRQFGDKSRLVALRMCDHECDRLCQSKKLLYPLYNNAFNRLFGASTLEYRWSSDSTFNYAYWFKRDPYHRTICISDWGHGQKGSAYRLPPPFIALRHFFGINQESEDEKSVLVAGERTPLFGMDDPSIQELYDRILEFIKQRFTGYRLLFKPRPGLTDTERLKLEGFEMVSPEIPFEELCLRNRFSRVISVKSTASKVAAFCGLPAYVVYPMFKLAPNLRTMLDAYQSDMRSVVKVSELDQLVEDPPVMRNTGLDELSRSFWQAVAQQ
ncbi:MAG: hypothetical protein AB1510_02955 [Bacillota bacterium]